MGDILSAFTIVLFAHKYAASSDRVAMRRLQDVLSTSKTGSDKAASDIHKQLLHDSQAAQTEKSGQSRAES